MKKVMTVEKLYKKLGELIELGHGDVPVSYDIDQAITYCDYDSEFDIVVIN